MHTKTHIKVFNKTFSLDKIIAFWLMLKALIHAKSVEDLAFLELYLPGFNQLL